MALLKNPTAGNVSVGTGSTQILLADGGRQYALIVNDSDTKMYLNVGSAAEIGKGIPLLANGGAVEITGENLLVGTVYAICSQPSKSISYFYV